MFLPSGSTPVFNSFQGTLLNLLNCFSIQYIWQISLSVPLEKYYHLKTCAVTSLMHPICCTKKNCDGFPSSPWRCIISLIHPHCDVVLWYSQPYGGRNLIFMSCKLDWRDHCSSFTMMADQWIRKQGWIIVPTSLSNLKQGQKCTLVVYFGLQFIFHVLWICTEVLSIRTSKVYVSSERQNSLQNPQYAQIRKIQL